MNYKIYCDNQLMAQFINASDRDVALLALQQEFANSKWTTEKGV